MQLFSARLEMLHATRPIMTDSGLGLSVAVARAPIPDNPAVHYRTRDWDDQPVLVDQHLDGSIDCFWRQQPVVHILANPRSTDTRFISFLWLMDASTGSSSISNRFSSTAP